MKKYIFLILTLLLFLAFGKEFHWISRKTTGSGWRKTDDPNHGVTSSLKTKGGKCTVRLDRMGRIEVEQYFASGKYGAWYCLTIKSSRL